MAESPRPLRFVMESADWLLEIRGPREPTEAELERWQTLAFYLLGPDADLPPSTSAAS